MEDCKEQSFTARMPLLTTTSTFRLGEKTTEFSHRMLLIIFTGTLSFMVLKTLAKFQRGHYQQGRQTEVG